MIANAAQFTYCGYLITQSHVTYVFKEGLLIEKLTRQPHPVPATEIPRPMAISGSMSGWIPLTPSDRWGHMAPAVWLERSYKPDDLRQLRADWLASAEPDPEGFSYFVLAHHLLGVPVMRAWPSAMVPADPRQPDAPFGRTQAVERLRHSDLAAISDTSAMGDHLRRSQAWKRLESPTVSAVLFSTGLYIDRHPDPLRTGFYPMTILYTHLTDEGARLLRDNPRLAQEMDMQYGFMWGQHDAPEGTGHFAWFAMDDSDNIVDHEVWDAQLLALDDPRLPTPLTQDTALQLLMNGHHAARWHPLHLEHIDALGSRGAWGCCGFVAGIQAAVHAAGRHELLRGNAYDTLAPMIRSFYQAHPECIPKSLKQQFVVTQDEFMQIIETDRHMRCAIVDLSVNDDTMQTWLAFLGLKSTRANADALPLDAAHLPTANAIFSVERKKGSGHWVYVTPQGKHLLWGVPQTPDNALQHLQMTYSEIDAVYPLG